VGAVGWVSEDNDIVGPCMIEEFWCVMRAVTIKQENPSLTASFLFSLFIKLLLNPLASKLAICPTIWGMTNSCEYKCELLRNYE
jgi:hypothetical protein